jgi:histone-lysine N-methyltransferase SETMAR
MASEKRMLIVFWGIHGIIHYSWLPKDSTLDSPFSCEKILGPLAQKCNQVPKNSQTLTLIHMDNARIHMTRATQEKLDVSRSKRTPQPPYSPNIASSDFFSVG